jgi:hypothetical protein
MSQSQLLERVVAGLRGRDLPFMLTGSYVSSYFGEPRATHDIDFVVQLRKRDVPALAEIFCEPDFYFDPDAAAEAIAREGMVNAIHLDTGVKIDFWILRSHPFDREHFSRRMPATIAGVEVDASSPEDVIVQKLRWAVESGGSQKQFTDALRVYEMQAARLDLRYIRNWIAELGVQELWERLLREARPLEAPPPE